MGVTPSEYAQVGPFPKFPTAKWFLAAYVRNVWTRLPALLAALTSTYGRILKIDSTKKVCRKLQGKAADTASWATSVGNERGEVLLTVLTSSEGAPALKPLADGLVRRYREAKQQPPILLYTDRDCCCATGPSKYQQLFSEWDGLIVRLDVWHFMRRIAGMYVCTCIFIVIQLLPLLSLVTNVHLSYSWSNIRSSPSVQSLHGTSLISNV
jgi:hypothetical protein